MTENAKRIGVLTISGLFILANCFALFKEFYYLPLVSGGLVLIFLAIYRIDWLIYLMALVTPLSILIENDKMSLGISIPSELIMILLTLLFLVKLISELRWEKAYWKHPITLAIFFYLFWMLVTSITSEIPLVSFKFLTSKLWFIGSSFFMLIYLIKDNPRRGITFFNLHAVGLVLVVIITTIKHAQIGFSDHSLHWIQKPFYNDHTAYGAVLAFMLPFSISFYFLPENKKWQKISYVVLSLIFLFGLYFSFSRAAWLSAIGALGVYFLIRWRIKFSWFLVGAAIIGVLFFKFSGDILYQLGKNKQDSSATFEEHIRSISNIRTDASNVERLNRWFAAFGMIEKRPLVGWGPGTYQFNYAPFQKNKYKTIISTNFGDGGNAHSEFIGPCAESGFIGLFSVLGLMITVLYAGITTLIKTKDRTYRLLTLAATLALISYYIHGIMNNFLDTDKLSLPFWGAFAIITVISTIQKQEKNKPITKPIL